jgi:RNA polymerase sigma factor for flagellar operon FliA
MNELIESHLGYAHAIAAELAGRYPPNITRSDLESAAELGLVQAARSYDPSRSVSFATFAYYRIRGAIFDDVRKSWQAAHLKCDANDDTEESAQAVPQQGADASYGDSHELTSSSATSSLISLDSVSPERLPATTESPASQAMKKQEAEAIRRALRQLPKRHRFVLEASYYEDLSLVSIGRQLNLSKSWVSRIHAQALSMLRSILRGSRRARRILQPTTPIKGPALSSRSSFRNRLPAQAVWQPRNRKRHAQVSEMRCYLPLSVRTESCSREAKE